jgi:hypothetical protein
MNTRYSRSTVATTTRPMTAPVALLARSGCVETPAFETRFRARAGVACQIKWALPGVWGAAAAPREWHLDDKARVLLEFGQVWMPRWGA